MSSETYKENYLVGHGIFSPKNVSFIIIALLQLHTCTFFIFGRILHNCNIDVGIIAHFLNPSFIFFNKKVSKKVEI